MTSNNKITRKKLMHKKFDDIRDLKPGMIIRHIDSSNSYMITVNYGSRATAVRTIDVTNCIEWRIVNDD